jgi:hypothetical protein
VSFPRVVLDRWDRTDEIEIETSAGPSARVHRTTIWIVVESDEVYVRSVRGPDGRWYRELLANPVGAVWAEGERVAVRADPANDATSIERVSQAIRRKYQSRWSGPTAAMLRPETLPTTLRLLPDSM